MVVVIVGWVAATPFTLRHPRVVQRVGFALIGPAERLFEHVDATPGEYTEEDISPYFWHNGQYPDSDEYKALFDGGFDDYRLRINGLVDNPVELSLAELRGLPYHEQITKLSPSDQQTKLPTSSRNATKSAGGEFLNTSQICGVNTPPSRPTRANGRTTRAGRRIRGLGARRSSKLLRCLQRRVPGRRTPPPRRRSDPPARRLPCRERGASG